MAATTTPTGVSPPYRGQGARILVVGEHPRDRELVRMILDAEGHRVVCASCAAQAMWQLQHSQVALVVTDLDIFDGEGIELFEQLRDTPVIVILAPDSTEPSSSAFRIGAEHYITRPLVAGELAARVHAVLCGPPDHVVESLDLGVLQIHLRSRLVTLDADDVDLTALEFDLLAFMASHPGRVYTRHQLLAAIGHTSSEWEQRPAITEHVRQIRLKLSTGGHDWLQTVRSAGYRFDCPPQEGVDGGSLGHRRSELVRQ